MLSSSPRKCNVTEVGTSSVVVAAVEDIVSEVIVQIQAKLSSMHRFIHIKARTSSPLPAVAVSFLLPPGVP